MPQFSPIFLDLSQLPEGKKYDNLFLRAVVQTLRCSWGERMRSNLVDLIELFREITQDGRDADPLKAFLTYVISAAPKLDRQELMEAIKQSFPDQGPALMSTIAEQYFLQGRQEGIEKGELIGMIRTCQSILRETELSEEELRSKAIEELRTMADSLRAMIKTRFGT